MLPNATAVPVVRLTTDTFCGLDCRPRPIDGACAALKNLTCDDYPVLTARPGRGLVATLTHPGGLLAKDALCWADAPYFYVNGYPVDLGLTAGTKQLVSMGAYALIFPDKKYLNTKDFTDCGSMEARITTAGPVAVTLCTRDGTALRYVAAAAAPESPLEGDLWLDTAAPALYRFTQSGWSEEADVQVKLEYASIGVQFSAGDGVTVSGAGPLDGLRVLTDADDDWLLLPGVTAAASLTDPVTISRDEPDLDFVTECGNRLWGCRYGLSGGETVNEILCCKWATSGTGTPSPASPPIPGGPAGARTAPSPGRRPSRAARSSSGRTASSGSTRTPAGPTGFSSPNVPVCSRAAGPAWPWPGACCATSLPTASRPTTGRPRSASPPASAPATSRRPSAGRWESSIISRFWTEIAAVS